MARKKVEAATSDETLLEAALKSEEGVILKVDTDAAEAKGRELIELLKSRTSEIMVRKMLANPFEPRAVKFKPQMVKGNRCLAMAYIDARLVMDRLDETVGVDNWKDEYEVLSSDSILCRLSVRIGGDWVTKCDAGNPSDQPDAGDRMKAAISDALKRAAVKFGIGRYLYRLPSSWVDYDPVKKKIINPPQMPPWALPEKITPEAAIPNHHAYGDDSDEPDSFVPRAAPSPAQPPAKQSNKPDGKLTPGAINTRTVWWRKEIDQMSQPEALNDLIREQLPKEHPDAKPACWGFIQDYAKERGWIYDAATKNFYPDDVIPY